MRITTGFNRLLRLSGAWVTDVSFGAEGVIVTVRLGRRRRVCPGCGDRLEAVPWARAGSPYTRDFEDTVAWLAQQMAKTPIGRLMRIGWRSVGKIVERVVSDRLDEGRLDSLVMHRRR